MLKNIRISVKLVIVGTVLMVLPLAIVTVLSVTKSMEGLTESASTTLSSRAQDIANLVDQVFTVEQKMALACAQDEEVIAAARAGLSRAPADAGAPAKGNAKAARAESSASALIRSGSEHMAALKNTKGLGERFQMLNVIGSDGVILCASDAASVGTDLHERDYFMEAMKGNLNTGAATMSKITNKPGVPFAAPIRSGDKVIGVFSIFVDISFIQDLIVKEKIGKTGYAFIVDDSGLFIAHPSSENAFNLNINTQKGMEGLAKRLQVDAGGVESYVFNGVDKTAGFARTSVARWAVILTQNDGEFLASAIGIRNIILIVAGIAVLAGFLIFWFFSRTITVPLKKGVGFAELVASGDFSQQLPLTQKDEVGKLADALNTMSVKLRGMVATIQDSAVQVASSSEQITASAQKLAEGSQSQASTLEETSASVEELTASVDQVAEHAQSQAAAVEQGSSSMAQVHQSIEDVSKNLTQIAGLASKSVENALEGAKAVTEVVEGINLIATSSEKIGGIINVISDIADQTNLLALNASIEAARAGEHGRGFAVVADEVSKLADRSSTSTKEIEGLIKESVKNVTRGVETAKGSQAAMEQIRAASQQVKDMITGLSESMQQQVNAVTELSKALTNISEMSQSISAATEEQTTNAKQVSKAVENVNEITQSAASAAEEMSSATEQLAGMAQELQKMTAQFKIGAEGELTGITGGGAPALLSRSA